MATKTDNWFDVDRAGLAKIALRGSGGEDGRGAGFILTEMLANCYDEDGCEAVSVTLDRMEGTRNRVELRIEDNGTHGFRRLSDSWTMFAPSYKADDPSKSGRFNLGCKLVLALCEQATITTTTGAVHFREDGTRKKLRKKLARGASVVLVLKLSLDQADEIERVIPLIVPRVPTTFNGVTIPTREPVRTIEATLPSEYADEEGLLHRTKRKTVIEVFEPVTGERGYILELGIPVVATGDLWTANVLQTVPLGMEREDVTPGFKAKLRAAVLNATHDLLTEEQASEPCVREGAAQPEVSEAAFDSAVTARFSAERTMYDPSDPEANSRALAEGKRLVYGSNMSKGERTNLRRFRAAGTDFVPPSGRVFPTHGSGQAVAAKKVAVTKAMLDVIHMTEWIAPVVLGTDVEVEIVRSEAGASAWFGNRTLTFNLRVLGHGFFNRKSKAGLEAVLDLVLHELAHHLCSDHLSTRYHRGCTLLGARLAISAALGHFTPGSFGYNP